MSEHAAEDDRAALRDDVRRILRIVLLALVGITAVLIAAAVPVIAVFTGDPAQTASVAPVLVAYLVGLIPFTVLFVVQRCFYALADTRTPFRFTLVQLAVVIPGILACALLPRSATALAIASVITLGVLAQVAVAVVLLRRRLGPIMDATLAATVRRLAVAGVPSLAAGLILLGALGGFGAGWPAGSRLGGALATVLVTVVVLAVYALVLAAQRAPELRVATDLVRSRLHR